MTGMLKHPHDNTVIGLLIDAVDLIGGCVIFKIFPLQRRDVFTKRPVKYEPDLQPNMLQNYFAYRSDDINNSRCDKKQNTVLRRFSHIAAAETARFCQPNTNKFFKKFLPP